MTPLQKHNSIGYKVRVGATGLLTGEFRAATGTTAEVSPVRDSAGQILRDIEPASSSLMFLPVLIPPKSCIQL